MHHTISKKVELVCNNYVVSKYGSLVKMGSFGDYFVTRNRNRYGNVWQMKIKSGENVDKVDLKFFYSIGEKSL